MKTNLLIAAALMLSTLQLSAQSTKRSNFSSHLKPQARQILATQQKATVAKPTGGGTERLMASSYYNNEGPALLAVMDSTYFTYSGSRTSLLSNLNPGSYNDYFDPSEMLYPMELYPANFNYLQYDSAYNYGLSVSILPLKRINTKQYDDQDRVTNFTSQQVGSSGFASRYLLSYNGDMQTPDSVWFQADTSSDLSGMYQTIITLGITYDGSDRRIADTLYYETGNYMAITYQYTPEGLLASTTTYNSSDGVTYEQHARSTYTYDELGRLILDFEEYNYGSGLENDYLDSFTYSGSSMLYTWEKGAYWFEGAWQPDYQMEATLMSFEAYNEVIVSYFDGTAFAPDAKYKMTYNANQHLLSQIIYYAVDGTFDSSPDEAYYYYYEDIPTAVAHLEAPAGNLLYPNPAANFVFIAGTGKIKVSVYNLSGQLVIQQSGVAQNGGLQLNVASLPAGTYVADVQTEKGHSKVKFVKQ